MGLKIARKKKLRALGLQGHFLDDVTNHLCTICQIALEGSRFKRICACAEAKGPDEDGVA